MSGIALIAHFAGDPADLTPKLHTAMRHYADCPDAPQPDTATLLRNKDGIVAVLVWPERASIQPFRTFLRDAIADIALPHPRVEHLRADENTWEAITRPH